MHRLDLFLEGFHRRPDAAVQLALFGQLAEHQLRLLLHGAEHFVGEALELHALLLELVQRQGVVVDVVIHHVAAGRAGRLGEDRLQVLGQGVHRLLVHQQLQHRLRLLPAWVVVILGGLVQAEGQVVVRADPVGGVDGTGLQRGKHFAAGQIDGGRAETRQHFAAEARHADLQPAQVVQRVDFLVVPAAHLHAGVADYHRLHAEGGIGFFPEFLAFALAQPGVHLDGRQAERHGGEELRGGHLALPVVGGAVAQFGGAAGDGIEHFQRRHQFAGGVDLDGQAAIAHHLDALGQAFGGGAQARVVFRPGGDHLPGVGLGGLAGGLLACGFDVLVVVATGEAEGGKQGSGSTEQMAAFHGSVSLEDSSYRNGLLV